MPGSSKRLFFLEPLVAKAKKVHSYQPYDPNVTLYVTHQIQNKTLEFPCGTRAISMNPKGIPS